jgi:hypothetical protein
MVIVNEGNRSDGFVLSRFPLFLHKGIPDHIPNGLGSGGITLALNMLIKPLPKLAIDGNAKT